MGNQFCCEQRTFFSNSIFLRARHATRQSNNQPSGTTVNSQLQIFSNIKMIRYCPSDFFPAKYLGKGLLGSTILVFLKANKQKKFAQKIVYLESIKQKYLFMTPSYVRQVSNSQKFVNVKLWMIANEKMYVISQQIPNGDMYFHLTKCQSGCFSEQFINHISIQIVLALQFLHAKNIIYRQLRPQNIMITKDGCIKLNDYCFSIYGQAGKTYVGPIQFAAPEILLRKDAYCNAVDIWAFGILLYEFAFGSPPFKAQTVEQQQFNILRSQLPEQKLKILWKNDNQQKITKAFKQLIERCLQFEPQKRIKISEIKSHQFFKKTQKQTQQRKYLPLILAMFAQNEKDPLILPKRKLYEITNQQKTVFSFDGMVFEDPNLGT